MYFDKIFNCSFSKSFAEKLVEKKMALTIWSPTTPPPFFWGNKAKALSSNIKTEFFLKYPPKNFFKKLSLV